VDDGCCARGWREQADLLGSDEGATIAATIAAAGLDGPSPSPGPAEMLALRTLANAIGADGLMEPHVAAVLDGLTEDRVAALNKGGLTAAATVLLNIAVAMGRKHADASAEPPSQAEQVLACAKRVLAAATKEATSTEGLLRALLAVGTVATSLGPTVLVLPLNPADSPEVAALCTHADQRVADAAKALTTAL
jgi:hypothetical protein